MAEITFWIGNGCLSSSVTTLMDALTIANLWHQSLAENDAGPLFTFRLASTDGGPVTAKGRIQLTPEAAITEVERTDCVVLANLLPNITPMPGNLDVLRQALERLHRQGATVATTCTGTFILAEMGLLDGKKATTNWQFARLFKKRYPEVLLEPEFMLTEDDNIVCTGAATAIYNLGIHLIHKFGSQHLAATCAKALLIDPNRHSQTPYTRSAPVRIHGDAQILKAQKIIEQQFASIETIDDIARDVGISPRHFKRRFKKATGDPPLKYLQRIRIEAAKDLLETTRETMDKITQDVGYQDISSFCRLFKQHTQISPKAYRDKFFSQVSW